MRGCALLILLALCIPSSAAAWSAQTHEAIAAAAQGQLTPKTLAAIAQILQKKVTLAVGALAGTATWPDDLRARQRTHTIAPGWGAADIEEADAFNTANPGNDQWHFVDLPLGASGYPVTDPPEGSPLQPFVGQADIVHALRRAIDILEAPTAPATFSKRQAVRWVVHLVGDLHQPMHVTSGYYNPTVASFTATPTRINDPVKAAGPSVLNDRGGNGLLFSASEANNLHSLWDRCLPGVVSGASCSAGPVGFTVLATKLTALLTPAAIAAATTTGDHHTWPAAWASDALHQAVTSLAYPSSLKNGRVKPDTHGDVDSIQALIATPTKNTYIANHVAPARAQLVKATARLAALLNALDWK